MNIKYFENDINLNVEMKSAQTHRRYSERMTVNSCYWSNFAGFHLVRLLPEETWTRWDRSGLSPRPQMSRVLRSRRRRPLKPGTEITGVYFIMRDSFFNAKVKKKLALSCELPKRHNMQNNNCWEGRYVWASRSTPQILWCINFAGL